MSNSLDRLCDLYGVLPWYHDIWGHTYSVPEQARRRLLAAMGVAADDEDQVAASLQAWRCRQWEQPLAPVQVVREPARPYRIALALPRSEDGERYRWRLRREDGSGDEAEFVPAALEESERCQLDGREFVRRILTLDLAVVPGYHRFSLERADGPHAQGSRSNMSFIVVPLACYMPPALKEKGGEGEGGRAWGFAAQLYGIRSERNYGMGDFRDLRRLLEFCAQAGADALLLNPLHANFPDAPAHASPYSPSNRAYFNVLYLDVESVPDFLECEEAQAMTATPEFQAQLRALRATEHVNYCGVAEMKWKVFGVLYQYFRDHHLVSGTGRALAFRAFQAERGESLRKQALFDAMQEHFRAQDSAVWGWPVWPESCRDHRSPEVTAFERAHLTRVEYFEYLQWEASRQLNAAGARAWELGLGIGMMFDLAIGVAEGGAATWTQPELYAMQASAGAPPDEFNHGGQDWGLPPWIPHKLTAAAYAPFIEMLRANMRDCGALRMDHVMGLRRLFWVIRGFPAAEGAYVLYPFEDMLGILALESQRNRCMVIGEDLGTVPDEVRHALQPMNVLSTRLLYFERYQDGRLKPPREYPANAVAAVTTHDLPTLAGFWQGLDIDLRQERHLFPNDEIRNRQIVERAADRAQLLVALENEGVLPPGSALHQVGFPEMTAELAAAVYTYLARSPCKLLLVQMEDGFGLAGQPNLPGTSESAYPNWRMKMTLNLEEWQGNIHLQGIVAALRRERPVLHPSPPPKAGMLPRPAFSPLPRATCRLQLNREFNLQQAKELVPYLHELGISHCYLSPLLKARPGSSHGYDITDHSSLNPEIASSKDFEQFTAALRRHGMGLIMDVVPNHMAIMGTDNGWWLDVLENGPASRFASYFDIDWYALSGDIPGQVLLPILGDHYGATLENGELKLCFDKEEGSFSVFYYEHRFPVDPREYPRILGHGIARLVDRLGSTHPELLELQSLITAFGHLPARDPATAEAVAERARDKEVYKHHLASLFATSADVAQFIEENVAAFNGTQAEPGSFDPLHELLQAQAYRLAFWRAADEINYRRFFDVNHLAALRMDNPEVFELTHRLLRELLARGEVNGLRIDHPDGLYDPKGYLERLQAMATALLAEPDKEESAPMYVVVEKILAFHEHLPESWPIHGTTGYDFSAACCQLFTDSRAADEFTRIYEDFIGQAMDLESAVRHNKRLIMETALASELQVLAIQLTRIAKGDRRTSDFTFNGLRRALTGIVANFPVYRTYVSRGGSSEEDARYVNWAVERARKYSPTADASIYDFIHEVLLARHGKGKGEALQEAVCAFAMKFQQYTAPVMAKAVEDTTFYQYNRLASLNEVGGEPGRFGISLAAFHWQNQERARRWPHAMLASSTHDNKRSEDARARISALSEAPGEWRSAISRWSSLNRSKRSQLDRREEAGTERAPSCNDEYLLYQTLLGVWPFRTPGNAGNIGKLQDRPQAQQDTEDARESAIRAAPNGDIPDEEELSRLCERVTAYMVKAAREAKLHSSWINPNAAYEEAMANFVQALLSRGPANLFLPDFVAFQRRNAQLGAYSSLSQLVLKLTSPGVPDIYQGNELWDFSLVDPDNRRPVDYAARRTALHEIKAIHAREGAAACAQQLIQSLPDGRIKLYLTWKTLALRRERESLFREGGYLPLKAHGERGEHVCAFARCHADEVVLVVVPRLLGELMGEDARQLPVGETAWGDTWLELPAELRQEEWIDAFTAGTLSADTRDGTIGLVLARLFNLFPYALLEAHKRDR
jgi:(1->4)-alpha-D-glucan 1-alpha-D-glucosylmutase